MCSLSSCKLIPSSSSHFLESLGLGWVRGCMQNQLLVLWVLSMSTYCMWDGGCSSSGSRFVFWMLILCLIQSSAMLVSCGDVQCSEGPKSWRVFVFVEYGLFAFLTNNKKFPLFWTHRVPLISRYHHNQILPVIPLESPVSITSSRSLPSPPDLLWTNMKLWTLITDSITVWISAILQDGQCGDRITGSCEIVYFQFLVFPHLQLLIWRLPYPE